MTLGTKVKTIGVIGRLSVGLSKMLGHLGCALGISFETRGLEENHGTDGWIILDADHGTLDQISRLEKPCFAVACDRECIPCGRSNSVEFARHSIVPSVLKGRRVVSEEAVKLMALPRWFNDQMVIAWKDTAPVWATRQVEGVQQHYVAFAIPHLHDGEFLFEYMNGKRFLQLLPLLVFLRNLIEEPGWEWPSMHACFMLDDPNIHWRTYGFIDFQHLADHAKKYRYHMCFATTPIDSWFFHKPTALVFQRYRDQLSLLIHGNNHMPDELAGSHSDDEIRIGLKQALARIDKLEKRSGIEISKVMAPPHGACSEVALREMAQIGFEAACVSSGSLSHHNQNALWVNTLGVNPCDTIGGLPVFPRFRISADCHNSILIAALLGQPIIPVGHHYDVADGLQLLVDLVEFANSLGAVRWADTKDISRAYYARRFDGTNLMIKMFSNRVEIDIPDGIDKVMIEHSGLKACNSVRWAWKGFGSSCDWVPHNGDEPICVRLHKKIEIVAGKRGTTFGNVQMVGNMPVWPIVRRQLTEARDRLAPVFRRFRGQNTINRV